MERCRKQKCCQPVREEKKDYTGEMLTIFIKRMFPDVMKDIELDSICNFK